MSQFLSVCFYSGVSSCDCEDLWLFSLTVDVHDPFVFFITRFAERKVSINTLAVLCYDPQLEGKLYRNILINGFKDTSVSLF